MNRLPAREFLDQFLSGYGENWEETFAYMTHEQPCAKHMAEFIDDVERHGQQVPAFIDKEGMVSEGNKMALALAILDKEIMYLNTDPPEPSHDQVWMVEFECDQESIEKIFNHLEDYMSFRLEEDWVMPLDAGWDDGEVAVALYCASGEYTADRLEPYIAERLQRMAGVLISGFHVSVADRVDEDTA